MVANKLNFRGAPSAVWFNRGCAYAKMGNKVEALKNLAEAIRLDAEHKEMAKKDDDFKSLWDDEDFKKLVS